MSVTSTDLLATAQRIFDTGSTEADWRATCSRAYYAVYHDGQAFADSLAKAAYPGTIPANTPPGMHHRLYTGLKNPTVPKTDARNKQSFKLGLMLENLHAARIDADYEPGKAVTRREAQGSMTTAKNVPNVLLGQTVGTPLPKFLNSSAGPITVPPPQPPSSTPTQPQPAARGGLKVVKQ
ncbi:hypothetical protein [Paraburkholderia sp. UCT2]|uniref:hypothetical protein n=1 Tax=Paraburkholderia sp. UCT2 TaxID=2615208 RepID=UPI001654E22A|nr:hypothetical protein [Paraburkholderia sp. UCT2]MBC8730031.1 hypothetical protein [Paraburkholderia sp. UCT2]